MNKRFFSFGCSFTKWCWPTWNDYIGINFDAYINKGSSGADNKNILYNLLQVDKEYKLNENDFVIVMFSSFNRMSYVNDTYYIKNIGDIIDHNIKEHPMGKTYNFETAIYDNCIAIQSFKSILESKNIKYIFLQSTEHDFNVSDYQLGKKKVKGDILDIYQDTLDLFKYPPIETWCYDNYDFEREKVFWIDKNRIDGHPTMKHHLDFVKEFFPQYITDKSNDLYNVHKKIFTNESQDIQGDNYEILNKKYFTENNVIYRPL